MKLLLSEIYLQEFQIVSQEAFVDMFPEILHKV